MNLQLWTWTVLSSSKSRVNFLSQPTPRPLDHATLQGNFAWQHSQQITSFVLWEPYKLISSVRAVWYPHRPFHDGCHRLFFHLGFRWTLRDIREGVPLLQRLLIQDYPWTWYLKQGKGPLQEHSKFFITNALTGALLLELCCTLYCDVLLCFA